MGIDLTWPREWKRGVPQAFSPNFPDRCSLIFYDGQLKLQMPAGLSSWANWVNAAFTTGISNYFRCDSVETIVLAFDDYQFSPLAKGPTQQKRKKASEGQVDWNEFKPLPPVIPPNYDKLLFNSSFKRRVVQFIMQEVMETVKFSRRGQKLIFDYIDVKYISFEEPHVLRSMHFEKPLGESDVKVVRYGAESGKDVLWIASDSDYICVALNELENRKKQEKLGNIYIRRLLVRLPEIKQEKKKGRIYEFLDCNKLSYYLHGSLLPHTPPHLEGHLISVLSAMVALCGCDFCEGIPWMTATTFKKNQAMMWKALCQSVSLHEETGLVSLNARNFADSFMVSFWVQVLFKSKSVDSLSAPFELVRDKLLGEVSSDRKQKALISPEGLYTNIRNVNWVLNYWKFPETCPCALEGNFGYTRDKKKRRVIFSTEDPLPARRK